jgi:hypothetical protein
MGRPPFGSPEWLPYFIEVVKSSKTRPEAARALGYSDPKTVGYHMQRFGIERPAQWEKKPWNRKIHQRHIPKVIIKSVLRRCWVAGLGLGESCIQSIYRPEVDTTYLEFDTAMVDPSPIFKLSEYCGLPPPKAPIKNHDWRLQWRKNVSGIRALRVLNEITPYMVGEKLREARKAIEFFSPFGLHRGCYRNIDIWPRNEFPLRSKLRGSNYSGTNDLYSAIVSKLMQDPRKQCYSSRVVLDCQKSLYPRSKTGDGLEV